MFCCWESVRSDCARGAGGRGSSGNYAHKLRGESSAATSAAATPVSCSPCERAARRPVVGELSRRTAASEYSRRSPARRSQLCRATGGRELRHDSPGCDNLHRLTGPFHSHSSRRRSEVLAPGTHGSSACAHVYHGAGRRPLHREFGAQRHLSRLSDQVHAYRPPLNDTAAAEKGRASRWTSLTCCLTRRGERATLTSI